MSQTNGTTRSPKRSPAKTLPMRGFLGEYFDDLVADEEEPSSMEAKTGLDVLVNYAAPLSEDEKKELLRARRVLQKAADRNDAEGFRRLLYLFCRELFGIKNIPEGAIQMRMPSRKPGRKPVPNRLKAYNAWVDLGQPLLPLSTPVLCEISCMVYGDEYKKAGKSGTAGRLRQKGMRDKCSKYIAREVRAIERRLRQDQAQLKAR